MGGDALGDEASLGLSLGEGCSAAGGDQSRSGGNEECDCSGGELKPRSAPLLIEKLLAVYLHIFKGSLLSFSSDIERLL